MVAVRSLSPTTDRSTAKSYCSPWVLTMRHRSTRSTTERRASMTMSSRRLVIVTDTSTGYLEAAGATDGMGSGMGAVAGAPGMVTFTVMGGSEWSPDRAEHRGAMVSQSWHPVSMA